jgi:hypothetical protein
MRSRGLLVLLGLVLILGSGMAGWVLRGLTEEAGSR